MIHLGALSARRPRAGVRRLLVLMSSRGCRVVLVSGLPLAEDFARQCLVAVSVGWGLACLARSFRSGRRAPSAPGAGKDRNRVMQVAASAEEWLLR
jgi:hypothetical protein